MSFPGNENPSWLEAGQYPFRPRYMETEAGRLHYVDEGEGEPLVMLHGNPSWSFLYRHLIKCLSPKYRCVAPDLPGFGLSEAAPGWSFLPEDHARVVAAFVDKLDLAGITLFVHDWGGPIGLSYALDRPDNMRRLVLFNTWMWSLKGDPYYERFSRIMGGPSGRLLAGSGLLFGMMMKWLFGSESRNYLGPLDTPARRRGCHVFPREIIGSSKWLDGLWERRRVLADIPALILWGGRDVAFRDRELLRWKGLLGNLKVRVFEEAGHFLQEQKKGELCPVVEGFLAETP
jgi:haloalkane dehalogenase